MKIHKLQREHLINTNIDELWHFFSDAKNLQALTPPYMKFTITSGQLPDKVYPGQMITYKVSPLLSIPLTWVTEITQVKEGEYFIDEQRIGPYKMWHHEHHFKQTGQGVLMTDIVHYALPFGPFGSLAHALFVKKQLNDIFNYRHDKIEQLFNKLTEQ